MEHPATDVGSEVLMNDIRDVCAGQHENRTRPENEERDFVPPLSAGTKP